MGFTELLGIFNYGLVLIYGLFLSTHIAGGWENEKQKRLIYLLCPLFLLIQSVFWLLWGVTVAKQLYPLTVHIPLVLILVLALKKKTGLAVVSVCTAYLCCQLPRWFKLAFTELTASPLICEVCYTLVIVPIYLLLRRYFVRIAHDAMSYSPQILFLFGSLPFVYYIFDYSTVIYSNALYAGIPALTEFFPTALIIFYVIFLSAYHAQTQQRTQAELQRSMLELELKQSGAELENMRRAEAQTVIYRHDLRHHLTAIDGFLSLGETAQAREYIRNVHADLMAVTLKRFCENRLVNLLCSSFVQKAEQDGIRLTVDTALPNELPISDTELCAILSNGLENALHAVANAEPSLKWVALYVGIQRNKLLIEIKNPYEGEVYLRDGLPVSKRAGHGYGCQSIRSITRQNRGICVFEAEKGIFTMRAVLPIDGTASGVPQGTESTVPPIHERRDHV